MSFKCVECGQTEWHEISPKQTICLKCGMKHANKLKKEEKMSSYVIKTGDILTTRAGYSVRILCTDAKGDQPVAGLIDYGSFEDHNVWLKDGRLVYGLEDQRDLILPAPKTKRVAPFLNKSLEGYYLGRYWLTKEEGPANAIWLEHLAVEVTDED